MACETPPSRLIQICFMYLDSPLAHDPPPSPPPRVAVGRAGYVGAQICQICLVCRDLCLTVPNWLAVYRRGCNENSIR